MKVGRNGVLVYVEGTIIVPIRWFRSWWALERIRVQLTWQHGRRRRGGWHEWHLRGVQVAWWWA